MEKFYVVLSDNLALRAVQSELLQKKAFEAGHAWSGENKTILFTNAKYIYFNWFYDRVLEYNKTSQDHFASKNLELAQVKTIEQALYYLEDPTSRVEVGKWFYDVDAKYIAICPRCLPIANITEDKIWCRNFNGNETYLRIKDFLKDYRPATKEEVADAKKAFVGKFPVTFNTEKIVVQGRFFNKQELSTIRSLFERNLKSLCFNTCTEECIVIDKAKLDEILIKWHFNLMDK